MTNEEILKKAIEKAVKNGYVGEGKWINDIERESYKDKYVKAKVATHVYNYFDIIFDHNFSKAVGYSLAGLGAWCDMGKDPLKYLEKFL